MSFTLIKYCSLALGEYGPSPPRANFILGRALDVPDPQYSPLYLSAHCSLFAPCSLFASEVCRPGTSSPDEAGGQKIRHPLEDEDDVGKPLDDEAEIQKLEQPLDMEANKVELEQPLGDRALEHILDDESDMPKKCH